MDTGTTAFMLCCIIGLTLMIPGLALFYGGMVSVKSSTNMMMMTFGAVAWWACCGCCSDSRWSSGRHMADSSAASPNSPA